MSDEDEEFAKLHQDQHDITSAVVERANGQIGTAMGDATVARNFNGFTVELMFDKPFVPELMKHIGECWNNSESTVRFTSSETGRNAVTNVQEEKDQDQDYLYDLPELCQREVASDSDSDDS
jgi:hypothetical protein